ncbi:MAG: hypothetical protein R2822_08140 [Spirosomataceae bacterium]
MNNSFQIKYLWLIVITLLLVNLGMLGWLLFTPKAHDRRQPPLDLLARELHFNAEQKKQYNLLKDAHHTQAKAIRDSAMMIKKALFNQLNRPLSDQEIDKATHEIAEKMAIVDHLTFKHFREVRQLCTPAQQQRFDEVIEDVLRHLAGGPAGDRPPPPLPKK